MKDTQYKLKDLYERGNPDVVEIKKLEEVLKLAKFQEEEYWKARSHIDWLKDYDKNTAYFHSFMKGRRRRNLIRGIQNFERRLVDDKDNIIKMVGDYFDEVFKSNGGEVYLSILEGMELIVLDEDFSRFDKQFEEEEVLEALSQINPNKTSGPDGITNKLLQEK
ncbi:hypothetical protein Scep_028202 [Stephania cephalantha]|uniref:Reverse transcriptase n=1 Tax=Stephania cephalantha TaxID=152367 RepID=A0AAP0EBP0_9MAGN